MAGGWEGWCVPQHARISSHFHLQPGTAELPLSRGPAPCRNRMRGSPSVCPRRPPLSFAGMCFTGASRLQINLPAGGRQVPCSSSMPPFPPWSIPLLQVPFRWDSSSCPACQEPLEGERTMPELQSPGWLGASTPLPGPGGLETCLGLLRVPPADGDKDILSLAPK